MSLTNPSDAVVKEQLEHIGLTDIVDKGLTVEGIRRFKPDLDVDRGAPYQLVFRAGDAMLVAAHPLPDRSFPFSVQGQAADSVAVWNLRKHAFFPPFPSAVSGGALNFLALCRKD